jgi:competence ComEA-like helix-hairpin-helix protein
MKKNRISESEVLDSGEIPPNRDPAKNIPVFLVIGLSILAISIFSSLNIVFQKSRAEASICISENFFWITGAPWIPEGLYRLSRKELEQNFPELLQLASTEQVSQKTCPTISAIQYNTGLPQQINLPPAVANVFFLPISINTAGKEILSSLPGIGPVLAEKIIHRRETMGLFRSKEELLSISGIGHKKLGRLIDYIVVN